MPAPQTVLIVEDDEAISDSIAYALDRAGFRTLRAGDGGQGLRLFRQQRPDLVILDLMLPQMDGWRVTEELRREDPRVPVIVCSARTSEFDRVHGLEMGADDYVTKPFSMKELLARVNAHLRRVESHRKPEGVASIEVEGLVIDPEQVQAFVDGRPVGFTPREFEVLYALARAEGKPVPRERVYREVWGYEMTRGDRSVDVFVRKVRQKLSAARPDRSYVQTHYGVGYRFEAAGADEARRGGRRGALRGVRASATLPGLCPEGGCPSGQRERSVKPPATPTEVRTLLPPLDADPRHLDRDPAARPEEESRRARQPCAAPVCAISRRCCRSAVARPDRPRGAGVHRRVSRRPRTTGAMASGICTLASCCPRWRGRAPAARHRSSGARAGEALYPPRRRGRPPWWALLGFRRSSAASRAPPGPPRCSGGGPRVAPR